MVSSSARDAGVGAVKNNVRHQKTLDRSMHHRMVHDPPTRDEWAEASLMALPSPPVTGGWPTETGLQGQPKRLAKVPA